LKTNKNDRIREAQGAKSKQIASRNTLKILRILIERPLTFSELLKETGFSRPVLAKHVRNLVNTKGIYKDTIKLTETLDNEEIGKIVYRYIPTEISTEPDVMETFLTKIYANALCINTKDWDEESKIAFRIHVNAIDNLESKEREKVIKRQNLIGK
jgi:DNA-binding Lrp family transcriptional regulator